MGSIKLAKKMVTELSNLGKNSAPDIIKFQKRYPRNILTSEEYNAPHPNPANAFGKTYGLHKEFLEFSQEQHLILKNYCEALGFTYSCSVFDKKSANDILKLNPHIIKISSANNNDLNLLRYIDDNFNGEIHISLGMTTRKEEENILKNIKNNKKNLVLYACTSAYPVPEDKVCLLEISRLRDTYENEIKGIGFSGHHLGITQDIVAVALGAKYIERHFTLDKKLKGTDQLISLEPKEFKALVNNIRIVEKGLIYKTSEVLDVEEEVRKRLKYKDVVCL